MKGLLKDHFHEKKNTHLRTPGDYLIIRTETGDLAFGGRIYIYIIMRGNMRKIHAYITIASCMYHLDLHLPSQVLKNTFAV